MSENTVQILVVDDNPGMLKVLNKWLKVAGYEVVEAWDGIMALDKCRQDAHGPGRL